jgi:hypothetical protein
MTTSIIGGLGKNKHDKMIKKMADIDMDIIHRLGTERAGQTVNHHRRPVLWGWFSAKT